MEIKVAKNSFSDLKQVNFIDGATNVDLGFQNSAERKILAETLLSAVIDLCYYDMSEEEYLSWIKENT